MPWLSAARATQAAKVINRMKQAEAELAAMKNHIAQEQISQAVLKEETAAQRAASKQARVDLSLIHI